jgi:hypothetical protein
VVAPKRHPRLRGSMKPRLVPSGGKYPGAGSHQARQIARRKAMIKRLAIALTLLATPSLTVRGRQSLGPAPGRSEIYTHALGQASDSPTANGQGCG